MIFGQPLFGQHGILRNYYFCVDGSNNINVYSIEPNDNIQSVGSFSTNYLESRIDAGAFRVSSPAKIAMGDRSVHFVDFNKKTNDLGSRNSFSYYSSSRVYGIDFARFSNKAIIVGSTNPILYNTSTQSNINTSKNYSWSASHAKFAYVNNNERLFIRNTSGSSGNVIELSPDNLASIRSVTSGSAVSTSNLNNFDITQDGKYLAHQNGNTVYIRELTGTSNWNSSSSIVRRFTPFDGDSIENMAFVPGTTEIIIGNGTGQAHRIGKFDYKNSSIETKWVKEVYSGTSYFFARIRNIIVDQSGEYFSYSMNGSVSGTANVKRFPISRVSDGEIVQFGASGSNSFTTSHGFSFDDTFPIYATPDIT